LVQTFRSLVLAIRLLLSDKVSIWLKLIPIAALLYVIFPFDFIPDFIPGLGQVDDLTILLVALWAFLQLCPANVVQQYRVGFGSGAPAAGRQASPPPPDTVIDADFHVVDDQPSPAGAKVPSPDQPRR